MNSVTCVKINLPVNISTPPQGFTEDVLYKGIGFQVDFDHFARNFHKKRNVKQGSNVFCRTLVIFFVTLAALLFIPAPVFGCDGGGPPILPHGAGNSGPPAPPCKHPKCCEQGAPSWTVNMVNMNHH